VNEHKRKFFLNVSEGKLTFNYIAGQWLISTHVAALRYAFSRTHK